MTGVRSTDAISSSSSITVRPQQSFAVNGRIRFGNDSFTFLDLQNNSGSSISLLRLNYALGTLATAKDKLGELLGLTDELFELAESASLDSTSNSKRKSINRRFQDKIEDFQELLDNSSKDGVDFLNKDELTGLLEFAGLEKELAGRLSSTFKRLAGSDSILGYEDVEGATVRYKKKVREQNPLRNQQVTQEENNLGQGVPFLKTTDSVTRNILFGTEAQYTGNSSGNALIGTATKSDQISVQADIADYSQRLLAVDSAGLLALVSTGDSDKAVLQFYSMLNSNAPVHHLTLTTLDTSYDSVKADVAPLAGSYAYLDEANTTIYYKQTNDSSFESLSVSGGTISQMQVSDGKIFFTSDATSLGANGATDDLFYFDSTLSKPSATRIASSTYAQDSVSAIEQFSVNDNGTRVAFVINEASDSDALAAGLSKDLIALEIGTGDYFRFEDRALYDLQAPTGSTHDYRKIAINSTGNNLAISQHTVGSPTAKSVAQYDITDITNPVFLAAQATGTLDGPTAVNSETQLYLGKADARDLNNDGKLDVVGVFTDSDANTGIATYLGKGNGTFANIAKQSFDSAPVGTGVFAVGDLTGDGYHDVIAEKNTDGSLQIYEGSGSGTFSEGGDIAITSPSEIALADANSDGNLDIFTASTSDVLYSQSTGNSFNSPTTFNISGQTIEALAIEDVNGDDNLDIITSGKSSSVSNMATLAVRVGNGAGNFGSTIATTLLNDTSLGSNPTTIATTFGDVNDDGTTDALSIIRGDTSSILNIATGNGDGTFQTSATYSVYVDASSDAQISLNDLNNDAIKDILVNGSLSGSGVTHVFTGRGDGTFSTPVTSTNASTTSAFFKAGDFDNDGITDALQAGSDSASGGASDPEFVIRLGGISQTPATGAFSSGSATTSDSNITLTTYPGTLGSETSGESFTYTSLGTPQLVDVDSDGNLDAVMRFADTGSGASGIVSFLGNADGTFQSPVTSGDDGGFTINGMTLGDFDGDSVTDAIVSSGTKLFFWSGQDDGTFSVETVTSAATSTLNSIIDLRTGDLDDDGSQDVTISGMGKSGPAVERFFGNGSGGFSSQSSQLVGSGSTVTNGLTVADVTGDGAPEIILGTADAGTGTITTLINNGSGAFSSSTSNSFTATSITGLDVGSVGLSANADLVAAATTTTGQVGILFAGDGSGTFTTSFSEANSSEVSGNIQLQDLNNDGALDIVQGGRLSGKSTNGLIRTYMNDGTGGFGSSTSYQSGSSNAGLALASADLDSDGAGDVLYAGSDGSTGYYTRMGDSNTTNSQAATSILVDLDQDGQMDIVSGLNNASYTPLAAQLGNSDGTFDAAITSTLSESGSVTQLVSKDFNNDGSPDIGFASSGTAATSNGDVVGYAAGVGDGTFTGVTTVAGTSDIYALQVGDVTGDGVDDLITAGSDSGTGEVRIYSGDGIGGFNLASPTTISGSGKSISAISLFDIEGDGDTDLIATEVDNFMNGSVRTYLNQGSGTFTSSTSTATNTTVTFADTKMARADLNNDGEVDVVVTSTGSGSPAGNASVLFGNGDGTFTLSQTYAQEAQTTTQVQLTDLNRDGQLDLLTSGTNASAAGEASFRLGVADGTFRSRTTINPGSNTPFGLYTYDVDNDGANEFIAIQNESNGVMRATVREPSYGTSGAIVYSGNLNLENITPSSTASIFGFSAEQSGSEEYFGVLASPAYGKRSNAVGSTNRALTIQLSNEANNSGGSQIFNPQLGGIVGGDAFFSTTANYGNTNPDGLEGFTKQDLGLAGYEATKVESSIDNAIIDVTSNGRYALIEDKNDDPKVTSLRAYDLETGTVAFDVGEFLFDQAGTHPHSAVISAGDEINVTYTKPGDTLNIYNVSSTAPNTITTRAVSGGWKDNLLSYDSGYAYSAKNGSPSTTKVYVTSGFAPEDAISTVDLGSGKSILMTGTSISSDGNLLATTDETNQLHFVTEAQSSPTIHNTSIQNVIETSVSGNGNRIAVLQQENSIYTVSLYRNRNNELILLDSTTFDENTSQIHSLSMNSAGTQISVARQDSEGNEEIFRAIDTTKTVASIRKKTKSISRGVNETIDPLEQELTDIGYSMIARETIQELHKEISQDLKDVTKVLDELSTTIRGAFKNAPAELRALSKGRSTEALQKFAQSVAEQIRATSYETLLLTNELDQGTALQLLRSGR